MLSSIDVAREVSVDSRGLLMDNVLQLLIKLIDFRMLMLVFLIFVPLERLLPIHNQNKLFRAGWMTDITHYIVSGIFIRLGLVTIILMATHIGSNYVSLNIRSCVASSPIYLQVFAITLVADFGFYVTHRLMHAVPWLWHFHAIHHSSEKLDWLAAYRVHPLDQVLVKGMSLVPIFILGFSEASIGVASIVYYWQSLFIHSNIRVKTGMFRWVIATPEFHHWHHSNHNEVYNKNFSGQLVVWDILFRTVHLPGVMPTKYGVNDPIPNPYLQQLIYPFTLLRQSLNKCFDTQFSRRAK